MSCDASLTALGYRFIAGPSGDPSDWVLRSLGADDQGFAWRGQDDYNAVGAAVVAHVQQQLTVRCGLEALPLRQDGATDAATVWASPGLREHKGPLLLLVNGMAPGGAAGVWGRSLCINASTLEGAMFDYVRRAQQEGWAVMVANPEASNGRESPIPGSECGHTHLVTLWRALLEPLAAPRLMIVAHSYGAPAVVHLLKVEAAARQRLASLALTDGWRYEGTSLLCEGPAESATTEEGRAWCAKLAALAPAAAAPPEKEVLDVLEKCGRNYAASAKPRGEVLDGERPCREGFLTLSAGHESHPSTTAAAVDDIFAFLRRGGN